MAQVTVSESAQESNRLENYSVQLQASGQRGVSILEMSDGVNVTPYASYEIKGDGSFEQPVQFVSGNNLNKDSIPTNPQNQANILFPWAASEREIIFFQTSNGSPKNSLVFSVAPGAERRGGNVKYDCVEVRAVEA